MKVKLQKWGNSLDIRIPKSILSSLNFNENDILKIEQIDDKFIITKSKKNKVSLKNYLINMMEKIYRKNLFGMMQKKKKYGKKVYSKTRRYCLFKF